MFMFLIPQKTMAESLWVRPPWRTLEQKSPVPDKGAGLFVHERGGIQIHDNRRLLWEWTASGSPTGWAEGTLRVKPSYVALILQGHCMASFKAFLMAWHIRSALLTVALSVLPWSSLFNSPTSFTWLSEERILKLKSRCLAFKQRLFLFARQ